MTNIKIIGGGVIGLTTAVVIKEKSNKEGRDISVEIIEKNRNFGDGSTKAAGCGLRTVYKHPANVELAKKGIEFWREAALFLGNSIGFRQNGYIFLTDDVKTTATFEKESLRQQSYGIPADFQFSPQSVDSMPELSYSNYRSLLHSPNSSLASPEMIVRTLVSAAKSLGIKLSSGKKVQDIERHPGLRVILQSGETKYADYVVNAAGGWSNKIAGMVDTDLPVWTARRRLSRLDAEMSPESPLVVDVDTGLYFLPSSSGQILAGGNLEATNEISPDDDAAFTTEISDEWVKNFSSKSSRIWNKLSDASVEKSWTGLYTMTQSRVPIIELDEKILHMTGFSGHGIMQAPGAAMVASRLLSQNKDTPEVASYLSIEREEMKPDIQF